MSDANNKWRDAAYVALAVDDYAEFQRILRDAVYEQVQDSVAISAPECPADVERWTLENVAVVVSDEVLTSEVAGEHGSPAELDARAMSWCADVAEQWADDIKEYVGDSIVRRDGFAYYGVNEWDFF